MGVATGIASHSPSASVHIAGLDAAAGRYVANSAGVVHVAKREAEAEAELMLTPTCTTADSDTLDMADTLDTDTLVCHTPDTDTPVWATTMVLDTLTTPESSPPLPLPPSIS